MISTSDTQPINMGHLLLTSKAVTGKINLKANLLVSLTKVFILALAWQPPSLERYCSQRLDELTVRVKVVVDALISLRMAIVLFLEDRLALLFEF